MALLSQLIGKQSRRYLRAYKEILEKSKQETKETSDEQEEQKK